MSLFAWLSLAVGGPTASSAKGVQGSQGNFSSMGYVVALFVVCSLQCGVVVDGLVVALQKKLGSVSSDREDMEGQLWESKVLTRIAHPLCIVVGNDVTVVVEPLTPSRFSLPLLFCPFSLLSRLKSKTCETGWLSLSNKSQKPLQPPPLLLLLLLQIPVLQRKLSSKKTVV